MSMRQETPNTTPPTVFTHLIAVLNRAAAPGVTLDTFLNDWFQALQTTWPEITRAAVYLHGDSQLRLYTGVGMHDVPGSPPEETSVPARAASQQKVIAPAPEEASARWGIPLDITTETPGALVVELPAAAPAVEDVGTTLETLRGLLALAIGHLYGGAAPAGTRAIKPALSALYQIARQLSTHPATPETLNAVCRNLTLTPGVIYSAIFGFDQESAVQTLITEHPAQLSAGAPSSDTPPTDTLSSYVQTNPTPSLVRSRDEMARIFGPHYARIRALPIEALLIAPLRAQNDIAGVLLMATDNASSTFSQTEVYVAEAIAAQIALSLRNSDLVKSIQYRANQLEQTTAFGRLVTSTFDEIEILQHVAEIIPKLLDCQYVNVTLHAAGRAKMRVFDLRQHILPNATTVAAIGSSVEEVVKSQTPLLIPDLRRSTYTDHKRIAQRELCAMITVPLIASQQPLGTLSIASKKQDIYTPTDLTLLQQIGTQVAIALENAQLFHSTQQRAAYEEALSEITSRLQQQTDLRVMLEQTMHDLGAVLGARRARVRLQIGTTQHDAQTKE